MIDVVTLAVANSYTDKHGGGSGTNDYRELNHKPQINSVSLNGNKSAEDLKMGVSVEGGVLTYGGESNG